MSKIGERIERGEMTVGTIGGPSVGSNYSYRVLPEQTHDKYFRDIDEWLARDSARAKIEQ